MNDISPVLLSRAVLKVQKKEHILDKWELYTTGNLKQKNACTGYECDVENAA